MFSQFINIIIAIFLCLMLFSQPLWADDIEAKLKQQEAKLIYEAASQLASDEEYDKAIRRFDRIISEYPETEYARLAEGQKKGIATLRLQPKPISGISRASLVGFGTLFTTWLGVGTLILVEADDEEAYGLALITGPICGLAGSTNLTRNLKLNDGQASLINLGGAWGVWQAVGTAVIADVDYKGVVGASMAGGIIGLALSGSIVHGRDISPGDATMINFGGIWGTWFALCGAMVADVEEGDNILASAMIGGDTGLLTMAALSPKLNMSRARARLINIAGIVGTLYGIGTNVLFEIDSKRNFWGVMGIGSALGLAAGVYFTRNYDSEKGYFAMYESSIHAPTVGLLNIESGERRWDLPVPTVAISNLNKGRVKIPELKLQMPLVNIKF
ncbi:hypothetical protein FJZ31_40860 [Candidatus Poribacteria bacterium]|nr:hypothetical protein [Candidatus Poribacteria bacterium]